MILGLFERVITIMESYPGAESFYKSVQPHYILGALAKNATFYRDTFNVDVKEKIEILVDKFIVKQEQKDDIFNMFK